MEFCHIPPVSHLNLTKGRAAHLSLAHLVEASHSFPEYIPFFQEEKQTNPACTIILDNSAFELYKAGLPMFDPTTLVDLASKVHADYIVLPDHPSMPSIVGIDDARRYAPVFREAGYGTFFVPQSDIGDLEDLIVSFAWAASSPLIDYIGVSILAVPNAYQCERDNKLQRFLARWKFMRELNSRGLLDLAKRNGKKIHFLGMVDGPNEITLCKYFGIDTWDSSAAVWAGLNNIYFDGSPTGLYDGKFEKHVDFSFRTEDNSLLDIAQSNMDYIDKLVEEA
tara:strand:+ start:12293 stop:13132 length:840 start_codon:yes stop_codon:yes gene_type:complete